MMLPQMLVQGCGNLHSTHHPQQERDVVDPFLFADNRLCLHASLSSHSPFPRLSLREYRGLQDTTAKCCMREVSSQDKLDGPAHVRDNRPRRAEKRHYQPARRKRSMNRLACTSAALLLWIATAIAAPAPFPKP